MYNYVKELAQDHIAAKWQSQTLNLGSLAFSLPLNLFHEKQNKKLCYVAKNVWILLTLMPFISTLFEPCISRTSFQVLSSLGTTLSQIFLMDSFFLKRENNYFESLTCEILPTQNFFYFYNLWHTSLEIELSKEHLNSTALSQKL